MLLNPLRRGVQKHQGFPVFPGAFPLIGHLPAIRTSLLDMFRRAEREYGPHIWINFGFGMQDLVCLHPEGLSLLKNKVTSSDYLEEVAPDIVRGTMVSSDGQPHRTMRAAINGPFQPGGLTAAEIGVAFSGLIEDKMKGWHAQREIDLVRETHELALLLMFRMMGIHETEVSAWRKQYQHYAGLVYSAPIDLPGTARRRGYRACAWMDERFRGFVQEARMRPEAQGLLTAVVRSFDASDSALSDEALLTNLRFLLFGGHETAANTMAWVVITLAQYPDVWDNLCAEASAVGAPPRSPKELAKFPYAEAVFREVLRLYPAANMTKRRATADFDIGGRTIQEGTRLSIPILHLSRHPDIYERPDEFVLARWLDRKQSVSPTELMQFGDGPHFCIGYHLASMEIVQFAVTLALTMGGKGLRPRLPNGRKIVPIYLPLTQPPASLRVTFA